MNVSLKHLALAFFAFWFTYMSYDMLAPVARPLIFGAILAAAMYRYYAFLQRFAHYLWVPWPFTVQRLSADVRFPRIANWLKESAEYVRAWEPRCYDNRVSCALHESFRWTMAQRCAQYLSLVAATAPVRRVPVFAAYLRALEARCRNWQPKWYRRTTKGCSWQDGRVWQVQRAFAASIAVIDRLRLPAIRYEKGKRLYPFSGEVVVPLFACVTITSALVVPALVISSLVSLEGVTFLRQFMNPGSSEFQATQNALLEAIQRGIEWLPMPLQDPLLNQLSDIADMTLNGSQIGSFIMGFLLALYNSFVDIALGSVVVMISLYYFLKSGVSMLRYMQAKFPMDDAHEERLFLELVTMVRAVIVGTLVIGFGQAVINGSVLYLAGVELWFYLTLLMLVLAVIPAVGATVVMIGVSIYLVAVGDPVTALVVGSIGMVVGTVDNPIRSVFVSSRGVSINEAIILLSTICGIYKFGMIGFVLGPVIWALMKVNWDAIALEIEEILAIKERAARREKLRNRGASSIYSRSRRRPLPSDEVPARSTRRDVKRSGNRWAQRNRNKK